MTPTETGAMARLLLHRLRTLLNGQPEPRPGAPRVTWGDEVASTLDEVERFVSRKAVGDEVRFRSPCGCDADPIECQHVAALGEAEAKIVRLEADVAALRSHAESVSADLDGFERDAEPRPQQPGDVRVQGGIQEVYEDGSVGPLRPRVDPLVPDDARG
jgi:hypothetical protein